jgi:hypothetical protein
MGSNDGLKPGRSTAGLFIVVQHGAPGISIRAWMAYGSEVCLRGLGQSPENEKTLARQGNA